MWFTSYLRLVIKKRDATILMICQIRKLDSTSPKQMLCIVTNVQGAISERLKMDSGVRFLNPEMSWLMLAQYTIEVRYSSLFTSLDPNYLPLDPCLGYIFTELGPHKRKLAILGDTHDASPVIPLCLDPSPSLLVHESTEAAIPKSVDFSGRLSKRTVEEVSNTALLRGHSTPDQAGLFAKKVGAERLVLNHIGGR